MLSIIGIPRPIDASSPNENKSSGFARKRRNIEATGAEAVICGNAGCTLQIAAELRRSGRDIPVLQPVEVLAAAYDG